jgi:L-seryl-tRNA(Ser) seleniumtransferase
LARAVRIDKVGLSGLATVLGYYLRGEAVEKIPVLRMITTPLSELEKRAERWAQLLGNSATVVAGESAIGGGSLPGGTLPTRLVVIKLSGEAKVQNMARRLRQHRPPIIGRVAKNSLVLDLRCIFPEEDEVVIEAVREAIAAFDHS